MLAAGAFQALNRRGIRVPEEISVIGLDGSQFGEMLYPALTTIAIDPMNIGREAVRNLIKRIPPRQMSGTGGQRLGRSLRHGGFAAETGAFGESFRGSTFWREPEWAERIDI